MWYITLNKEKTGYFVMYCLSVYLIQIQSYRAFSKMAVDHWCLSLRVPRECDLTPSYIKIGVHGLIPDDITKTFY